jgi:hypothetical protein
MDWEECVLLLSVTGAPATVKRLGLPARGVVALQSTVLLSTLHQRYFVELACVHVLLLQAAPQAQQSRL